MKKYIFTLLLFTLAFGYVAAQEYKISKSTGTLDIREVNRVTIEGTTGNEIIFSSRGGRKEDDGRAAGLRAITGSGLEDNTNLGLSVIEKNGVYEVRQLKKMDGPEVRILVPKGVKVVYSHTSPHGSTFHVKNYEGELEVSTVHSNVEIENVTGPLNIKTVHGNIDATLSAGIKNPVSITSVHAHVDVAMPTTTKANLKLSTSWGEIFVDPDFKIEIERTGDLTRYSDKVNGTLNGGGIDITLGSSHDNVYLRKR